MPPSICRRITKCRICGSDDLRLVLDLGEQYIASVFGADASSRELNQPYPLRVVRCGGGCGLVQLEDSVSPDVMYDNYGYRSGINEMMRRNLREITAGVEQMVDLQAGDAVLDIGCNDGTLLQSYSREGIRRLGFDPSSNVAAEARAKGFEVVGDYFSAAAYEAAFPGVRARAVTSIAMFYDLEDPCAFVRDVAAVLADDGVWIIELSYLPLMLERNSYDTVCHEHLEYYSLHPIEWMMERAGLAVHRVEFNDTNGGSFRLFIRKAGGSAVSEGDRISLQKIRDRESELRLTTDEPYRQFREAVLEVRDDLRELVGDLVAEGKRIYVYGASTKGNTILQFCNLTAELIPKAADRNPEKWGKRTLGTDILIVSEEEARQDEPDLFLVLPWHFVPVFLERERPFLDRGGRFIVPLPEVRLLDSATPAAADVAVGKA